MRQKRSDVFLHRWGSGFMLPRDLGEIGKMKRICLSWTLCLIWFAGERSL